MGIDFANPKPAELALTGVWIDTNVYFSEILEYLHVIPACPESLPGIWNQRESGYYILNIY
jgi:hypothetical protein